MRLIQYNQCNGECSSLVHVDADIELKLIPDESGKNHSYINLYQSEFRHHGLSLEMSYIEGGFIDLTTS